MNEEQIKNRNRITAVLDNCAKLLSVRKDMNNDLLQIVINIRKLAGIIRGNTTYEYTINKLYSQYEVLVGILNYLRSNKNAFISNDRLNKLSEITNNALNDINSESLENSVKLNTKEYYDEQIQKQEKALEEINENLTKMEDDGQKQSSDYKKLVRKKIAVKTAIYDLQNKSEKRKEMDDRTKALNNKVEPLTTNVDNAIKELTTEKNRLEEMYGLYKCLLKIVLVVLLVWESFLIYKLYPVLDLYHPLKYVPFYLPIPLVAGLLWMCIYQINKAQHKMVLLANTIQKIKYKDSLLHTSINLYADMRKNEDHVAQIIDKIIESNDKDKDALEIDERYNNSYTLPFDNIIELVKAFTHK